MKPHVKSKRVACRLPECCLHCLEERLERKDLHLVRCLLEESTKDAGDPDKGGTAIVRHAQGSFRELDAP